MCLWGKLDLPAVKVCLQWMWHIPKVVLDIEVRRGQQVELISTILELPAVDKEIQPLLTTAYASVVTFTPNQSRT